MRFRILARVPRVHSSTTATSANMIAAKPAIAHGSETPNTKSSSARDAAATVGAINHFRSDWALARRQGRRGPTPINMTNARRTGPLTRLKYGAATVTSTSLARSAKTGYITPQRVTAVTSNNRKLLTRNDASRDMNVSTARSLCSWGSRQMNTANAKTRLTIMNPRKT